MSKQSHRTCVRMGVKDYDLLKKKAKLRDFPPHPSTVKLNVGKCGGIGFCEFAKPDFEWTMLCENSNI